VLVTQSMQARHHILGPQLAIRRRHQQQLGSQVALRSTTLVHRDVRMLRADHRFVPIQESLQARDIRTGTQEHRVRPRVRSEVLAHLILHRARPVIIAIRPRVAAVRGAHQLPYLRVHGGIVVTGKVAAGGVHRCDCRAINSNSKSGPFFCKVTRMYEIRMDHPGKNALSTALLEHLERELQRADGQPVLLTGTGDAFSAGVDLKEIAALDKAGIERFLTKLEAVATKLFLHAAPTVALVNGHAIAGGCILAQACDWRLGIASERARMGLNELAIGASIPPACLRIVRHRLPPENVERVVFGAKLVSIEEALRLGLLDEIVQEDAMNTALTRLQAYTAHPRATYTLVKLALRGPAVRTTLEEQHRLREQEVPIWASTDMKQRIERVLGRGK